MFNQRLKILIDNFTWKQNCSTIIITSNSELNQKLTHFVYDLILLLVLSLIDCTLDTFIMKLNLPSTS